MPHANHTGKLRIIGGSWRSRRLTFPVTPGLRPTPDAVRETVFNWLAPIIEGANCLDLFAGSGALGFEALSRGAAKVVMLEQSSIVIKQLLENQSLLKTEDAIILQAKIPDNLSKIVGLLPATVLPFDIVFLDPPFHKNLLGVCCEQLENGGWLKSHAHIYLEAECTLDPLPIPTNWEMLRLKTSGQINYGLARRK